jgi:hypothetical protein
MSLRTVSAVLAMLVAAAPAHAADESACDAVEDTLEESADLLEAVRDGETQFFASRGDRLADAAQYALHRMREAAWGEPALSAATGIYVVASAFRRGLDAPPHPNDLLAFVDALVAEAVPVCGADIVPPLARPGVGDARACDQVIEALQAAARALPTVAGEPGAPPPMLLMVVATQSRRASSHAEASQWSAGTIAALTKLGEEAGALQRDHARFSADTAAAFAALAQPAIVEARAICGEAAAPVLE